MSAIVVKVLLAALVSHYAVFKRYEPDALQFLVLVAAGNVGLISNLLAFGDGWLLALRHSSAINVLYFALLAASIGAYRLSPFHPLSRYPGPPLAKLTKWYIAYFIAKGERHLQLKQLHEKYGRWVRIGPNELSVNDPAAVRPIYAQMYRGPSYQGAPVDADALTTIPNKEQYSARLPAWRRAFSAENIKSFRPLAEARTAQLIDILRDKCKDGEAIDLSHWISMWGIDIMGDMSFSGGFEKLAAGKDEEGWTDIVLAGVLAVGVLGQVPYMRDILRLAPTPGPIASFQRLTAQKVRETRRRQAGVHADILSIIQDAEPGEYELSEAEAASDASFLIVAGWDTVSQCATTLFRHVFGDRAVLDRARTELLDAFGDDLDLDHDTLLRLPYLDACVQEALRIMPPVAAGPPRTSGDVAYTVLGEYIPPKTVIACPTYTLHRCEENFTDADKYIPERWLGERPSFVHNVEAFVPFSSGIGMCLGRPVALFNLKLLAAHIVRTFDGDFPRGFSVGEFDRSYKEHNLWRHGPLMIRLHALGQATGPTSAKR
ncbi:cytochrome P450 [Schizophyllum commune]